MDLQVNELSHILYVFRLLFMQQNYNKILEHNSGNHSGEFGVYYWFFPLSALLSFTIIYVEYVLNRMFLLSGGGIWKGSL